MSEISQIKNFINGADFNETLYKSYVKNLYSYGISLGFSNDICMDAIHDVFCKLYYIKEENISGIKNVKHYLFTSFKNRLFDIYRQNKRLAITENIETLPFGVEVSILDSMIDEENRKIMVSKIESLMSCLTSRQKEAIYLRYIQEMDYEEIASLLNISPKSCKMLVFRSMNKLKDFTNNEKKLFFIILGIYFLDYF